MSGGPWRDPEQEPAQASQGTDCRKMQWEDLCFSMYLSELVCQFLPNSHLEFLLVYNEIIGE